MKRILFVCREKHGRKQKEITTGLRQEGWDVLPADIGSINFSKMRCPDADLAVIYLHPEVSAWKAYLDFKKHLPDLAALVYMGQHQQHELNSAIKHVFWTKPV